MKKFFFSKCDWCFDFQLFFCCSKLYLRKQRTALFSHVHFMALVTVMWLCKPLSLSISRTLSLRKPNLRTQKQLLLCLPSSPPSPWQWPFYFLFLRIWLLCVPPESGTMQYLSFGDWLLLLSVVSSGWVHMAAHVRSSLPSNVVYTFNIPLYVYATFCLFSQPLMDSWVVVTFWLWCIMLLWMLVYK